MKSQDNNSKNNLNANEKLAVYRPKQYFFIFLISMTTQRQAIDNCTNNNDYNSSNDNSNNKNNNYKKRSFVFFNFNQIFWLQCISEATKNIISNVGTTTTTTISTKNHTQ